MPVRSYKREDEEAGELVQAFASHTGEQNEKEKKAYKSRPEKDTNWDGRTGRFTNGHDRVGEEEVEVDKPAAQFARSVHRQSRSNTEDSETLPISYLVREVHLERENWQHYVTDTPRKSRHWQPWLWRREKKREGDPQAGNGDGDPETGQAVHKQTKRPPRLIRCMHPLSRVARFWSTVTTITDAVYTAFFVPLGVAFHFNPGSFSWYNAVNFVGGAVYLTDVYMGFTTGIVVVYNLQRCVVTSPHLVCEFYVKRGTFWVDIIACFPLIVEAVVLGLPGQGSQWTYHVLLLLRLVRMWRVFKLIERLLISTMIGSFNRPVLRRLTVQHLYLFNIIYATAVFMNLLACLWYYVATLEGLENSWLTSVGGLKRDISDASSPAQWVAALYYVTATIATVGYGDITAVSTAEECAAIFIMILGILFFGFVLSISTELVGQLSREARQLGRLREKLDSVERWTRRRHLSNLLKHRIRLFYASVWVRHQGSLQEAAFLDELPDALRNDVVHELTGPMLSSSNVFKNLDWQAQHMLSERLVPESLSAGHNLTREGDDCDCIWFLQEGELLCLKQMQPVEVISAPAICGRLALLSRELPQCKRRPETLRAILPCSLWRLTLDDLDHLFEAHEGIRKEMAAPLKEGLERKLQRHWPNLDPSKLLSSIGSTHGGRGTSSEKPPESKKYLRGEHSDIKEHNDLQEAGEVLGEMESSGGSLDDVEGESKGAVEASKEGRLVGEEPEEGGGSGEGEGRQEGGRERHQNRREWEERQRAKRERSASRDNEVW